MAAVYVVRTEYKGKPVLGIFDELRAGRARIGWSHEDVLDLRSIRKAAKQGKNLSKAEHKAKRCLGFLTRPVRDDYLLYPNQPERGKFCVVRVAGCYEYSSTAEGIDNDFRSYRPCSLVTETPVDLKDSMVSSQLRYRLGKQGRFSKVHDPESFFEFLADLEEPRRSLPDESQQAGIWKIHRELRKNLPDAIRRQFSSHDLSRLFCRELFERMGYAVEVQEGPAEAGSDVVVTISDPLLHEEANIRIGIQVFAYEGDVQESALRGKLKQLLRGWEDNELDHGVLLTTGRCTPQAAEAVSEHNANELNKDGLKRLIRLIDADDLADLFLRYFPPEA